MAGGTMCYRDALQRPARPSSLSVGSRVHVIPKRRAQGQAQYGQYASSPIRGTPAPAPSLPVREDSRKTALVAPSEERICPQPQTPHKDQYERLYGTFETRQKRELFQESRYSSKNTRAGSSYWTRRLPQNWREQKSTLRDHIPGWETGTAFAREKLPARSTSSLCRVYPRDGTGKVHGVKDSDSRQSHGPAASTDDENTWPGRPMRKSETRDYQRASPHARENTCAKAQSPVSQTEPVPQSLLQMMPKLREELDSLDESWKSFQAAWTALLKDRRSANDRTWPTFVQVLGKMTEQVLSPDYSDQQADLPRGIGYLADAVFSHAWPKRGACRMTETKHRALSRHFLRRVLVGGRTCAATQIATHPASPVIPVLPRRLNHHPSMMSMECFRNRRAAGWIYRTLLLKRKKRE
ncbi:hypothetical protein MTO96_003957 [Rhipicephalus appendiculatus]